MKGTSHRTPGPQKGQFAPQSSPRRSTGAAAVAESVSDYVVITPGHLPPEHTGFAIGLPLFSEMQNTGSTHHLEALRT